MHKLAAHWKKAQNQKKQKSPQKSKALDWSGLDGLVSIIRLLCMSVFYEIGLGLGPRFGYFYIQAFNRTVTNAIISEELESIPPNK